MILSAAHKRLPTKKPPSELAAKKGALFLYSLIAVDVDAQEPDLSGKTVLDRIRANLARYF